MGTDLAVVERLLRSAFKRVSYHCETVRLSDFFDEVDGSSVLGWPVLDDSTQEQRISTRMTAGDKFREALDRGDALALFSMLKIRSLRLQLESEGKRRRAYLLWSLKHPDEVAALREVYGNNFYLVAAYSPEDTRVTYLAKRIARDHLSEDPSPYKAEAIKLIERDKLEEDVPLGQGVRDTFPKADLFVDARMPNGKIESLNGELTRFVEIIFGHPYHTPNPDEQAMFHAQAAALRSAALGRQVGAAITDTDESVVAVGCNEVPKTFGGQYWTGEPRDNRDFLRASDDSVEMKTLVAEQILDRLKGSGDEDGWLARRDVTTEDFLGLIKGTRARSLIEFERSVHAEMAAILDAGRRGQTLQDGTVYTTTFPCHECTRHLIGAGIRRVVYIEPYPKSLAPQLHDDAISIDVDDPPEDKVHFEPFVGVAPRRALELFTVERRRDEGGGRLPAEPNEQPKSLKPPIEMERDDLQPAVCEACGHENPAAAKYCNKCGKQVASDEPRQLDEAKKEKDSNGGADETVLSDPAIRFQEFLKVQLFRKLLEERDVRLNEEVEDG